MEPKSSESASPEAQPSAVDAGPASLDSPIENYDSLETKVILEKLDLLSQAQLEAVKTRENDRKSPRKTILKQVEERLAAIDASAQEVIPEHDPVQAAEDAKKEEKRSLPEEPDEEDEGEPPYAEGSIREQAEASSNDPDVQDPVEPILNPGYVKRRDPVEAAKNQESPTASGPDDLAQRDAAAQLAAEPLRKEVELSTPHIPEGGSTHEQAVQAAEAGDVYPEPPVDPEKSVEDRDEATDESMAAQKKEAKATLKSLKGDDAVIAEARENWPGRVGDDDTFLEQPVVSAPSAAPITVGDKVSRVDQAHHEIGVVTAPDPLGPSVAAGSASSGLLEVTFPDAGKQLLNVNNLHLEGRPSAEQAIEDAYKEGSAIV